MTDFTETRSMLKKAAMAEPGDTLARRAYHNLLEMTENIAKPDKPDEWPHRRRYLAASMEAEQRRLAAIRQNHLETSTEGQLARLEYRNRKAGE